MTDDRYVLISPVRNEESYIERTLKAVINQTKLPAKWVIVSDGSEDRTDEIVRGYAQQYAFIDLVRRETNDCRSFASKVFAFREGLIRVANLPYDFIGNQDGDCSFDSDYYENVLRTFVGRPKLGIAGGVYHEYIGGEWIAQRTSTNWSVTGGVQLFRRECYEQIGGYLPLTYGGVDSAVEITARARGWQVQSDPKLVVLHHRRSGRANRGVFAAGFRSGQQEYALGYSPVFAIAKHLNRISEPPYLIGSLCKLAGYFSAWIIRKQRVLDSETTRSFRKEQRSRLTEEIKTRWLRRV